MKFLYQKLLKMQQNGRKHNICEGPKKNDRNVDTRRIVNSRRRYQRLNKYIYLYTYKEEVKI